MVAPVIVMVILTYVLFPTGVAKYLLTVASNRTGNGCTAIPASTYRSLRVTVVEVVVMVVIVQMCLFTSIATPLVILVIRISWEHCMTVLTCDDLLLMEFHKIAPVCRIDKNPHQVRLLVGILFRQSIECNDTLRGMFHHRRCTCGLAMAHLTCWLSLLQSLC